MEGQNKTTNIPEVAKKQRYLYLVEKIRENKPLSAREIKELEKFEQMFKPDCKMAQQAISTARQSFLVSVMTDEACNIEDRLDAARLLGREL